MSVAPYSDELELKWLLSALPGLQMLLPLLLGLFCGCGCLAAPCTDALLDMHCMHRRQSCPAHGMSCSPGARWLLRHALMFRQAWRQRRLYCWAACGLSDPSCPACHAGGLRVLGMVHNQTPCQHLEGRFPSSPLSPYSQLHSIDILTSREHATARDLGGKQAHHNKANAEKDTIERRVGITWAHLLPLTFANPPFPAAFSLSAFRAAASSFFFFWNSRSESSRSFDADFGFFSGLALPPAFPLISPTQLLRTATPYLEQAMHPINAYIAAGQLECRRVLQQLPQCDRAG